MSGHIDVEVLSDLVEGLLTPEQASALDAHLAECAECRDTRDALAEVRELLGGQPVEPMPADVIARIDDALALAALPPPRPAEAPSVGMPFGGPPAQAPPAAPHPLDHNVVPLDAARRRRRRGPLLLAAAAVAAVALGVTVLVGTGGDDKSAGKPAAARDRSAASAPEPGKSASSGKADERPGAANSEAQPPLKPSIAAPREYTAAGLPDQVSQLLRRTTATSLGDLPGCVAAAVGPDAARALAVDNGSYAGKPAWVVVLNDPSADRVRVYIVDASCSTQLSTGPSGPLTGSVLLATVVPRG
ncbi:anti-sigma factor family protein [Embleya sp. NPDC020886]|uniref:anti-sigma factor family protein n=1 Tax=Embleya sp. NPDC020886 TaxID=3363980 RepID=UPI0037AB4396